MLERYCSEVQRLRERAAWFDDAVPEHSAEAVFSRLSKLSEEGAVRLFGNAQFSPGTAVRKAVTVKLVAAALVQSGVSSRRDLLAHWEGRTVASNVLAVQGAGLATWRYICSLSRIERVKPDTMVTSWVRQASGVDGLTAADAAGCLEAACRKLQDTGTQISVRTADHLVWRKESGRPLT